MSKGGLSKGFDSSSLDPRSSKDRVIPAAQKAPVAERVSSSCYSPPHPNVGVFGALPIQASIFFSRMSRFTIYKELHYRTSKLSCEHGIDNALLGPFCGTRENEKFQCCKIAITAVPSWWCYTLARKILFFVYNGWCS